MTGSFSAFRNYNVIFTKGGQADSIGITPDHSSGICTRLFPLVGVVKKRSAIRTFFLQSLMPRFLKSKQNYEKRYNLNVSKTTADPKGSGFRLF